MQKRFFIEQPVKAAPAASSRKNRSSEPVLAFRLPDRLSFAPVDLRAMTTTTTGWFFWAILSAVFAALTAIFAKIGIQGVDSDLATLVRTAVVIVLLALFVWFAGKWSNPLALPRRTLVFLTLSGIATGASWVCYFRALQIGDASRVAPVDKFSLVLVALFAVVFLGERPTLREWGGIALVACGVLVLALKR
jgi:transporter family protein